jgi:hypothetical protein
MVQQLYGHLYFHLVSMYDVIFGSNQSFCWYFIEITKLFSLRKNSLQIHEI